MDDIAWIIITTGAMIAIGIIVWLIAHYNNIIQNGQEMYDKLASQKKSSEVRLGQISEHLVPFTKSFPFDPKQARFLGSPVDMVVFTDDKIVIVEVKTGGSQLSEKQKKIRKLVEDKKIEWFELRIE